MTFVYSPFLWGGLLVGVPIVLHLIMRQKPRRQEFPALRFIQKRRDVNRRRMRLQHLLLLALRMAAIVLLALALAQPSLAPDSAFSAVVGDQEAPVAAALVFDTAPRMEYRHENQSRLEAAQEIGRWLLAQLPEKSQFAVIDTRPEGGGFQVDRGSAEDRIDRLETITNSRALVDVVEHALGVLQESKLERKEIYVFTDLSQDAWPADQAARLQRRIGEVPGVGIYLIDVGVEEPRDFGLGTVRLSQDVITENSPLTLETQLTCLGPGGRRTVELMLLEGAADAPAAGETEPGQRRNQQVYELKENEARSIRLELGVLERGMHQGVVRVLEQDNLTANNERFFSFEVQPPWKVLVVRPSGAETYLVEALAPEEYRKMGRARFDCRVIPPEGLAAEPLEMYDAVCLLDPPPLEAAAWSKLANYAATGGGVAIFLGRRAKADAFNKPEAQKVLPGKLSLKAGRFESWDAKYLDPDQSSYRHPVFAYFPRTDTIPWDQSPVFRYWQLGDLTEGVRVIASYTNRDPAVLEQPIGQGRVITVTTPVSDRPTEDTWNLLPVDNAWPFWGLANGMMLYLVGSAGQQLNYQAGDDAVLHLDEDEVFDSYVLTRPDGERDEYVPDNRTLTISENAQVGNYRIQGGGQRFQRGFSVNLAPRQTELRRVGEERLGKLFGDFPYQIARTRDEINRKVSLGRTGKPLFPYIVALLALALAAEHVVANRFYRD